MTAFTEGDRVTPVNTVGVPPETLGRVFVVVKVNPKNLRCCAEDGGRGINFPPHILLPATDENVAAGRKLQPFTPVEFFDAGQIVTLKRPWRSWATDTPLVVLKDDGKGKVNVTLLGGADGQYLRISSAGLEKRGLAWLYGARESS